ncbi:hypothetical protein KJ652_00190 [Patescibacteria group bacterium]|nr:hypothetical protein [Patescibacteria group bacterium]MBU1911669.1 hypothetical protein [Patescibacteria group bacterium]
MKEIYSRKGFPSAPGSNIYHWQGVDTLFEVQEDGYYVLAVTASAKNAAQNNGIDDDDLRMELDGYKFGEKEIHEEKISWKGFGTASAWDGASLRGGTKTTYFFVELSSGEHQIKFYADETPALKEIKVLSLEEGKVFDEIFDLKPEENIDTDEKGIPWLSFVFLGVKPKDFELSVICNATTNDEGDGDNIKIVTNGAILQNKQAPTSDKYKNFYFSGDLDRGEIKTLKIPPSTFKLVENSVELWYDQTPEIHHLSFSLFESHAEYLEALVKSDAKKDTIRDILTYAAYFSRTLKPTLENARLLLLHSLKDNPSDLEFGDNDSIVNKIKSDHTYNRVKEMIADRILHGETEGTIEVGGQVVFEAGDLFASLHGLKTIDFVAVKTSEKEYEVEMVILDTYDFSYQNYSNAYTEYGAYEFESIGEKIAFTTLNNIANVGEYFGAVNNFEIRIHIEDTFTIE